MAQDGLDLADIGPLQTIVCEEDYHKDSVELKVKSGKLYSIIPANRKTKTGLCPVLYRYYYYYLCRIRGLFVFFRCI